ncbi:HET-domain-containing protein [Byssothecium circinans]|uniref:HET-domain-containing protein n=1 Tax=Byssothecium circinans TaxID=147558 RepID=A0A6A5TRF6_9PLEO|nr:HET-domain-containing protein [Byssothecium circinans]
MAYCDQCLDIDKWLTQHRGLQTECRKYEFTAKCDTGDCISCRSLGLATLSEYGEKLLIHIMGETPTRQPMIYLGNERTPLDVRLYHLRHTTLEEPYDERFSDLDLARGWLDQCDNEHGATCNLPSTFKLDMDLLFVDVEDRCIVRRPAGQTRYAALSYVWGKSIVTKATSANIESLKKSQSLSDPEYTLPKSIEDSIFVTARLGIRYLWCDCLCIIQDDRNLQTYLNAMASIYAHAHVTIAITNAKNADEGIMGLKQEGGTRCRKLNRIVSLPNHQFKMSFHHDLKADNVYNDRDTLAPWSLRGWTFQEGSFSRRMLIFNGSMSWVCSKCYRKESSINQSPKETRYEQLWPDWSTSLCRIGKLGSVNDYRRLVEQFARREFTFDSDILDAFAGTMALPYMDEEFPLSNYFYGHPLALFERSLLWAPQLGELVVKRDPPKYSQQWMWTKKQQTTSMPAWSCFSWRGDLDLKAWMDAENNLPTQRVSTISKQCYSCGLLVDIRMKHCCRTSAHRRAVLFSPYIILRTRQAEFSVRIEDFEEAPMGDMYIIHPKKHRTSIGAVRFQDFSPQERVNFVHQHHTVQADWRISYSKYTFVAIYMGQCDVGRLPNVEEGYSWKKAHGGSAKNVMDCVYALCVVQDYRDPTWKRPWVRIGSAAIEKDAWDEFAGEEKGIILG